MGYFLLASLQKTRQKSSTNTDSGGELPTEHKLPLCTFPSAHTTSCVSPSVKPDSAVKLTGALFHPTQTACLICFHFGGLITLQRDKQLVKLQLRRGRLTRYTHSRWLTAKMKKDVRAHTPPTQPLKTNKHTQKNPARVCVARAESQLDWSGGPSQSAGEAKQNHLHHSRLQNLSCNNSYKPTCEGLILQGEGGIVITQHSTVENYFL